MIVLDTNVISEIMKHDCDPAVLRWFNLQSAETLFLTAINFSELKLGIEILPKGRRRESLELTLNHVVGSILENSILPFDESAATQYAQITAHARRSGLAISIPDGQIAAIASVHSFAVATRDTAPFEAAGVAVINPWQA